MSGIEGDSTLVAVEPNYDAVKNDEKTKVRSDPDAVRNEGQHREGNADDFKNEEGKYQSDPTQIHQGDDKLSTVLSSEELEFQEKVLEASLIMGLTILGNIHDDSKAALSEDESG